MKEGGKYAGNAVRRPGAPRGGKPRCQPAYQDEEEGYGAVKALDPVTGQLKWEFKLVDWTETAS